MGIGMAIIKSREDIYKNTTDTLKVSLKLDEKYASACRLCLQKHEAIYGVQPHNCAYRQFDNEYCPDIVNAEKQQAEKDAKFAPSEHLEMYLSFLSSNDGHSYKYIVENASEFSKIELIALVRAFDYAISPYINHCPEKVYEAVAKFTRNELRYGHSIEQSRFHKPLAEMIAANETKD